MRGTGTHALPHPDIDPDTGRCNYLEVWEGSVLHWIQAHFGYEAPTFTFQRIDEKTARGPGIIDMKGGDVVMIQALKALHAAGTLDRLSLSIVLMGDEELTGEPLSAAREALVSAAKGAEIALGFEDGPGDPRTAVIAPSAI